jgi:hypothetical protein
MQQRESRHDVDLPARLRGDESWSDVCIRSVSSHGMMLLIASPPVRGTYIEVRRGSAVVIGRVMWIGAGRCGLRTKDRISVADLTMANVQPKGANGDRPERRTQARLHRPEAAVARSAAIGRVMQFAAMVALVLAAGGFLAHTTYGLLAKPSKAISQAFG